MFCTQDAGASAQPVMPQSQALAQQAAYVPNKLMMQYMAYTKLALVLVLVVAVLVLIVMALMVQLACLVTASAVIVAVIALDGTDIRPAIAEPYFGQHQWA